VSIISPHAQERGVSRSYATKGRVAQERIQIFPSFGDGKKKCKHVWTKRYWLKYKSQNLNFSISLCGWSLRPESSSVEVDFRGWLYGKHFRFSIREKNPLKGISPCAVKGPSWVVQLFSLHNILYQSKTLCFGLPPAWLVQCEEILWKTKQVKCKRNSRSSREHPFSIKIFLRTQFDPDAI